MTLGLFQGSSATITSVLPATLFGRKHLGKITASMYISSQLTSAAGSTIFGIAKDAAGSYRPLFLVLIFGLVLQMGVVTLDAFLAPQTPPQLAKGATLA